MARVKVWSERPEPHANGLRDCTYSSGLMGLVFGGFTGFPKGIYTVDEREALERSDDQPDETGASLSDLVTAVKRRYDVSWSISRIVLLAQHHARSDLGFIIQGRNGNLPAGDNLRRWDPSFTGGHCVFINPTGDGQHVHWYDPEAPMEWPGEIVRWDVVSKWIGNTGSFITVREDAYAPKAPKLFSQAELDAAIGEAIAEDRTRARVTWD